MPEKIQAPKQIIGGNLPDSYINNNNPQRTREITYTEYNVENKKDPQTRIIKKIYYNNNNGSNEEMILAPINRVRIERNENVGNKKRNILIQKKLYYLFNKIEALKTKKFYLDKWEKIINQIKKNKNKYKNHIIKEEEENFTESVSADINDKKKDFNLDNEYSSSLKEKNISNKSESEEENEENNNKLNKIKNENNVEIEKEDDNIIDEMSYINNKIVNRTTNLIKSNDILSKYKNIYLTLLKNNSKIISGFHIFNIYSKYNDKNNIGYHFKKWKNKGNVFKEIKINSHIKNYKGHCICCECEKLSDNNCYNCYCKSIMNTFKKMLIKFIFLKEINPKKYYFNLWNKSY